MSTTRWIIETDPNCEGLFQADLAFVNVVKTGGTQAEGVRAAIRAYLAEAVVDPDNLPPERVERAVRAFLLIDEGPFPFLTDDELWQEWWEEAGQEHYADPMEAAVRAFLSDPEPGDSQ